jgi:cardiolipin synthase
MAGLFRRKAKLTLPAALRHAEVDLEYARNARDMLPNNRVELLIDGDQTFAAMLNAIAKARSYVHLETYILVADRVGELFAAALIDRARAGVAVRLMYDGMGAFGLEDYFVHDLRRAGVEVLEYRPIARWRNRSRWARRDHRKILVVDGVIGFTGGLNLSLDYAPKRFGGGQWRDTHIRVRGPVVAQLNKMFRTLWLREGGPSYKPYARASIESVAGPNASLAVAVSSDEGRRSAIRRHYLHAIRRAEQLIYIANAYFLPDPGIRRALIKAAKRGVKVQIIVPEKSDVRLVQYASEHTFSRFLKAGIEVFQWQRAHMHAKTAVIDGTWSNVGSYNLDSVSLFRNLEVVVEIVSRAFGTKMIAQFETDRAASKPVMLEEWKRRRWWRRWVQWFAYRFRRWM